MASTINAKNTSTGVVITPDASGQLELQTADTTRMTIDVNGSVGIGTSSPNAKVDSNQATGFSYAATRTSTSGYNGLSFYENTTNTSYIVEFGSAAVGGQRLQMWTNTAFPIVFGTNNTERMRITSNGGVSFGSSGTAYGTSGQVLQSNGDAAPTWVTPASGGVTSLNGQTGAITNTDLYAIGSYVTGMPASTSAYGVNSTIAGSSLYSTMAQIAFSSGLFRYNLSLGTNAAANMYSLINVGTWRCVSPVGSTGTYAAAGLWVRIS